MLLCARGSNSRFLSRFYYGRAAVRPLPPHRQCRRCARQLLLWLRLGWATTYGFGESGGDFGEFCRRVRVRVGLVFTPVVPKAREKGTNLTKKGSAHTELKPTDQRVKDYSVMLKGCVCRSGRKTTNRYRLALRRLVFLRAEPPDDYRSIAPFVPPSPPPGGGGERFRFGGGLSIRSTHIQRHSNSVIFHPALNSLWWKKR